MSMVEQGTNGGSLYFSGAIAGARVFIDGTDMGDAMAYDGRIAVLGVTAGPHRVALRQGGTTLYDRQVYVGADARMAIEVP
jgi:hypothetical protein